MTSERASGAEPILVDAASLVSSAPDDTVSSTDTAPADDAALLAVPGVIPHDEADGRTVHDWQSRYPPDARRQIGWEGAAVAAISIGSLLMIFLVWSGLFADWTACAVCSRPVFARYGYFFLGGVLGGTLFGIKYLYHVVAKGFWNQDRRLWRLLSPLLAGSLAFIVGALTDAGFLGLTINANKASAFVSLGFITGYFGDKALAKMTEMADVIFGTREASKSNATATKGDGQK
ncbi:hypothetical protein PQQ86_15830 [Paraburkholderia sediminicola]|uniref:hypothetical protein n=1 Tax=Paraburkholderia sediminicola TaxID=458836 RepID=UPI0038B83DC2